MAIKYVISVSVADLREKPEELPKNYAHHDARFTQLLFGEKLELLEQTGEWLKIRALEQMHFSEEEGWHACYGWILKTEATPVKDFQAANHVVSVPYVEIHPQKIFLSFGSYVLSEKIGTITLPDGQLASLDPKTVRPLTCKIDRKMLVRDAKKFLGFPYLWGGRAAHHEKFVSSVDCSGLVNLLYRAQGITIPRNSHPQYLFGKKTDAPRAGDPIYLAKAERISHVIVKLTEETYIESPETGKAVRILRWGKDLWEENNKWVFKDRSSLYSPYFVTFVS